MSSEMMNQAAPVTEMPIVAPQMRATHLPEERASMKAMAHYVLSGKSDVVENEVLPKIRQSRGLNAQLSSVADEDVSILKVETAYSEFAHITAALKAANVEITDLVFA